MEFKLIAEEIALTVRLLYMNMNGWKHYSKNKLAMKAKVNEKLNNLFNPSIFTKGGCLWFVKWGKFNKSYMTIPLEDLKSLGSEVYILFDLVKQEFRNKISY